MSERTRFEPKEVLLRTQPREIGTRCLCAATLGATFSAIPAGFLGELSVQKLLTARSAQIEFAGYAEVRLFVARLIENVHIV